MVLGEVISGCTVSSSLCSVSWCSCGLYGHSVNAGQVQRGAHYCVLSVIRAMLRLVSILVRCVCMFALVGYYVLCCR